MALSPAVVARILGITTTFKNLRGGAVRFLPQHIGVVGQGNTANTYSTTKKQYTSASAVGAAYGFGSPVHLAARQLLPVNGDGLGTVPMTIFPLDDDVSGVAATGDITLTGTATENGVLYFWIGGIRSAAIVITSGDAGIDLEDAVTDAINAVLEMPVTAVADGTGNKSDLTSKWKGASANDILIESEGEVAGITIASTAMASGAVNPDVDIALNQIGDTWVTMLLNCMDLADTTTLDKYQTWGDGRWGALVHKPSVVLTGNPAVTAANAILIPDARKTDKVNIALPNPGSRELPFAWMGRGLSRIGVVADLNPPVDYGRQSLTGIEPGTDAEQWLYPDKDLAVKGGSSTVDVVDGVMQISDIVTFYHPTGEDPPAYRFLKDIVRIQNLIFNLWLIFSQPEWDGAPLIPDDQATVNPAARKPKDVVAAINALIDNAGLEAWISAPEVAKTKTVAVIDSQNPNRINASMTVQLSGNTNVVDIDFNFGFFFGVKPVIA